jgi:hypothetical protein
MAYCPSIWLEAQRKQFLDLVGLRAEIRMSYVRNTNAKHWTAVFRSTHVDILNLSNLFEYKYLYKHF